MNLRRGGPQDRPFVRDLGRRTIADSISHFRGRDTSNERVPDPLVAASFDRLVEFAFEQSYVLHVAEVRGEAVGFLLMLDRLPDEVTGQQQAFIAYMAVEPHARRRRVATQLLAAAEASARERGLPFLALMVTEENDAARELYAQAGFLTERRLLCKVL